MCDNDLTVWLIECNTNPCLDESSSLLRRLLPRMLDDAFRLTIDRDFVSPLDHKIEKLNEIKLNKYSRTVSQSGKRISRKFIELQNHNAEVYSSNEVEYQLLKLQKQQEKQKNSTFELPGYQDDDNLWQKIMDIDVSSGKPKTKQNIKVNSRTLRSKNCLYVSPFDNQIFLADCESYKQFV